VDHGPGPMTRGRQLQLASPLAAAASFTTPPAHGTRSGGAGLRAPPIYRSHHAQRTSIELKKAKEENDHLRDLLDQATERVCIASNEASEQRQRADRLQEQLAVTRAGLRETRRSRRMWRLRLKSAKQSARLLAISHRTTARTAAKRALAKRPRPPPPRRGVAKPSSQLKDFGQKKRRKLLRYCRDHAITGKDLGLVATRMPGCLQDFFDSPSVVELRFHEMACSFKHVQEHFSALLTAELKINLGISMAKLMWLRVRLSMEWDHELRKHVPFIVWSHPRAGRRPRQVRMPSLACRSQLEAVMEQIVADAGDMHVDEDGQRVTMTVRGGCWALIDACLEDLPEDADGSAPGKEITFLYGADAAQNNRHSITGAGQFVHVGTRIELLKDGCNPNSPGLTVCNAIAWGDDHHANLSLVIKDQGKEIQHIEEDGYIERAGKRVFVRFCIIGDNPFISSCQACDGVSATYQCAWCCCQTRSDRDSKVDFEAPQTWAEAEQQIGRHCKGIGKTTRLILGHLRPGFCHGCKKDLTDDMLAKEQEAYAKLPAKKKISFRSLHAAKHFGQHFREEVLISIDYRKIVADVLHSVDLRGAGLVFTHSVKHHPLVKAAPKKMAALKALYQSKALYAKADREAAKRKNTSAAVEKVSFEFPATGGDSAHAFDLIHEDGSPGCFAQEQADIIYSTDPDLCGPAPRPAAAPASGAGPSSAGNAAQPSRASPGSGAGAGRGSGGGRGGGGRRGGGRGGARGSGGAGGSGGRGGEGGASGRGRGRGRGRGGMASLSSLVIDENDQNAVNESAAPMLTMADFLLLWRSLKALRNVLKRKVDRSDDEAVDKMALDAYKAAGRYARQLARWTRSKPVYPHILQFIVPRLVKQLRGAIWSASTQALEHDGKTLKKDLELTSKHGKKTRFKRRTRIEQGMRNRIVRENIKLRAHKDAAARTTKGGALRTRARPASQARA